MAVVSSVNRVCRLSQNNQRPHVPGRIAFWANRVRTPFLMLVVLPFHAGDKPLAIKLAQWIRDLGGVSNHDCLMVHDHACDVSEVDEPLRKAFRHVSEFVAMGVPKANWQEGKGDARACNEMWIQTAGHIFREMRVPWLWMEPDCTPLFSTWSDDFQSAYTACRKPFMGAQVKPSKGLMRMSGIGFYPAAVCEYGQRALLADKLPWDVAGASEFLKHTHFTNLIQHVLRTSAQAPTFPTQESLSHIMAGAVLFHPCKDGSLIDRLREKKGGDVKCLTVVPSAKTSESNTAEPIAGNASPSSNPMVEAITEASAIEFLATRSKRSGIDKGRITRRLAVAGFALPKKKK